MSIASATDAPYSGTVFISSEVLTPTSPSDFQSLSYTGIGTRKTFDRRVNAWINANSYLFTARYECAVRSVEIIVNADIDRQEAEVQAGRFARVLGQLPFGARKSIREIWVHPGDEYAGGGNASILIYTGYADTNASFLEEVFIHEAAHTSLDWTFGGAIEHKQWQNVANMDGRFISQYASDNPDREDIAESYGAFLVHETARRNAALQGAAERIGSVIPNRLNLFRSLGPEFGTSRDSCPDYTAVNQQADQGSTSAQPRTLVLVAKSKGTRILSTSLSASGILEVNLRTKLSAGTQVSLTLGTEQGETVLTQIVGSRGTVGFRADITAVQDVSIHDDRNRLIVRWRIR